MFGFSSVAPARMMSRRSIEKQSQEFSGRVGERRRSDHRQISRRSRHLHERRRRYRRQGNPSSKARTPTPPNVNRKLTQSDFKVEVHGNVAVTSFTDNLDQQLYGQTLKVEIPLHRSVAEGRQRMENDFQPDDDRARTIRRRSRCRRRRSTNTSLGTYEATPAKFKLRITRDGDGLVGSTNDGKPYPIQSRTARRARHTGPADAPPHHSARLRTAKSPV